MADDQANTDALIQAQNTLEQSIQNNVNMAEKFYNASRKANGEQRTALEGVAELYDSIAKKEQELLEVNKEMVDLDKEHFKLIKEQQKLQQQMAKATDTEKKDLQIKLDRNKQELALHREIANEKSKILRQVGQDLDATRKQVQEMAKAKGFLGEIFTSARAGAIAAITSAVALKKAFENLLQVGRDSADIAILSGSYEGFGEGGGIIKASQGIYKYAKDVSAAQISLAQFGFTAEEAKTSFKNFSAVSTDTTSMKLMTEAAGGLSKMLGVDLSETTDFMIEQNLKFNKTASQSAETLMHVQQSVENLNKGFDRSIIRGRDITKVLFDISRESRVLAQDQDQIAKVLTSNILKLQAGGANYKEAFESAKTFTNVLTKDAPEFMKILSGREVYSMLKKNSKEVIAELAKTSPEIAKRVEETMNNKNLNQYEKERIINEMTAQTKVGMEASMKVFARTMGVFQQGAVSRIQSVFGVGFEQARQIVNQAKQELGIQGINEMLQKGLSSDAMTKEIKTKFDIDVSKEDLDQLKGLDKERQEAVLRAILDEKAVADLRQERAQNELVVQEKIKKAQDDKAWAEEQFARTGQERYKKMAENSGQAVTAAQEELDKIQKAKEAEQGKLGKVVGTEEDKYGGKDPIGQFFGKLRGALQSPLAQLGIGIAGAGLASMQFFESKKQTGYLQQIAENTGGEGGPKGLKGMMGNLLKKVASPQGLAVAGALTAVGVTGYAGYEAYQAYKDKDANAKTKGKAYGGLGGALAGAGAGAFYGAALGSVVPGFGTVVGGAIGAGVGAVGGYFGGKGLGYLGGAAVDSYRGGARTAPVDTRQFAQQGGPGQEMMPGQVPQGPGITQQAELVPGAQGTDIQLVTKIPFAQALRMNMTTMNRFAVTP